MNKRCPRCGQNLVVHARGPATITCPVCLASVAAGAPPLPAPPLPLSPPPVPVVSLEYENAAVVLFILVIVACFGGLKGL